MYDRNLLCLLPAMNTTGGSGVPAAMDLTAAAATEANVPITMAAGGTIDSIFLQVTTATVYATTLCVLAVHVNDVEVGTVSLPTAITINTMRSFKVTPATGKNLFYKAGDVLKIEIKTQGAGAGLAGAGIPYLGVRSS